MIRKLWSLEKRVRGEDEGAAMVIAMFTILVLASVSILVLGTIVSQVRPTQYAQKDARTISSAEAGIDASLGAMRNAVSADPNDSMKVQGDRNKLPCWNGHVGSVGAASGASAQYRASIQYFLVDPSNQSPSWRAAQALSCTSGLGPSEFPHFALITSEGTDVILPGSGADVGNRVMETVYEFNLTNVNISGGQIRMGTSSNSPCIDAGTSAAGAQVKVVTCVEGKLAQLWSHRPDFTVQLTSTNADPSGGLCLSANPGSQTSNNPAVNVTLATCNGGDQKQRWGYDNGRAMFGRITQNINVAWHLMVTGSNLQAGSTVTATLADPSVGAGAAGNTSDDIHNKAMQLVNYKEFGRCMDITDWILNYSAWPAGRPSQILYPCKQDPMRDSSSLRAAQPGWNQVFTWSATDKLFWANESGNGNPSDPTRPKYCMQSPGVPGGYVNFDAACNKSLTKFRWTVNRDTGSAFSRYTIVDGYGLCLALGARNPVYTPVTHYPWSSVKVEKCDGGPGQKWNAPPNQGEGKVTNTREITGA